MLSRGIHSTIASLLYVNTAICNMRKIPGLMWQKEQENISHMSSTIWGFKSLFKKKKFFFILFSANQSDTFKCFSLFGLIHILLDTSKPLVSVVASLISLYVPPSRWHQPTCQGMHMSTCKRCFLLEAKVLPKTQSNLLTHSDCLLYACTQRLAAREKNSARVVVWNTKFWAIFSNEAWDWWVGQREATDLNALFFYLHYIYTTVS